MVRTWHHSRALFAPVVTASSVSTPILQRRRSSLQTPVPSSDEVTTEIQTPERFYQPGRLKIPLFLRIANLHITCEHLVWSRSCFCCKDRLFHTNTTARQLHYLVFKNMKIGTVHIISTTFIRRLSIVKSI